MRQPVSPFPIARRGNPPTRSRNGPTATRGFLSLPCGVPAPIVAARCAPVALRREGMSMKRLLLLAALLATNAVAEPTIAPTPAIPTYGQQVGVELQGTSSPVFLPATRYTKSGNSIVVEYEYLSPAFGPYPPMGTMFGSSNVNLGELAPGNYAVTARLI